MRYQHRHGTAFENLEKRVLFAQINVTDFGAVPNDGQNDTAAIQRAINASSSGDTIQFSGGVFEVQTVKFRGSRDYRGTNGATLRSSGAEFAASIDGDARDVTVSGLRLEGAGLAMGGGQFYRNIRIVDNQFANMNSNAIKLTVNSDGVAIERNTFTNIQGYGALESYNTNNFSYSYNRIIDSKHAGHILGPRDNNKINYNWITGISIIGLEIQDMRNSSTRDLQVVGNIMYDFRNPVSGNIPLSIPVQRGSNTRIADNYIKTTIQNDQWGSVSWMGKTFGIAVEAGGNGTVVANNTIGGPWQLTNLMTNANGTNGVARDNKYYGKTRWHPAIAPNVQQQNNQFLPSSEMPGPEAWLDKRAQMMGAPSPNPTPQPTPQPNPSPSPSPSPAPSTWLSDLAWVSARNGLGPVELDRTNGQRQRGDGKTLTLNGRQFEKGLGVHADSEIVYRLDGRYEKFAATVGVDDDAYTSGSVVFQVFADGRKIYDSGVMTGSMAGKDVEVDVRSVNELKLVVTTAGDNGDYDHADWAAARLISA